MLLSCKHWHLPSGEEDSAAKAEQQVASNWLSHLLLALDLPVNARLSACARALLTNSKRLLFCQSALCEQHAANTDTYAWTHLTASRSKPRYDVCLGCVGCVGCVSPFKYLLQTCNKRRAASLQTSADSACVAKHILLTTVLHTLEQMLVSDAAWDARMSAKTTKPCSSATCCLALS